MSTTTTTSIESIEAVNEPSIENTFEKRTDAFERAYTLLNDAAPAYLDELKPSAGIARNDDNEQLLRALIKQNTLPWLRKRESLTEYVNRDKNVAVDYQLQLFFSTCEDIVIDEELTRAETETRLEETREKLANYDGSDAPADGTAGMAQHCLAARINTLQWLLGEYHGE